MAHARKSRNQINQRRKARPRRASTPSTPKASYKALPPTDAPRHQYKKHQLRRKQTFRRQQDGATSTAMNSTSASTVASAKRKLTRQTRAASLSVLKAKREQWASMAAETQGIVLGDGKYVEERCLSVHSPSLAQPVHQETEDGTSIGIGQQTARAEHDIAVEVELSRQGTTFYPHYCEMLALWASAAPRTVSDTIIEFTRESTLTAARRLWQTYPHLHMPNTSSPLPTSLAILSYASPKKPGGGYLHGGDEQEGHVASHSPRTLISPRVA